MTLWTVAPQALLSMGFSRQENWNGLPLPSPGDLPNPGIERGSQMSFTILCSSNVSLAAFMGLIVYHLCHLSSSFSLSFHIHYIFITINFTLCVKSKKYILDCLLHYSMKTKREMFQSNRKD